jgi:ribosomal protein S18 acetylase RimI-like enzyme
MLAFIDIDPRDSRYAAELDLRYRVLRAPLGLSRAQTLSAFEEQSVHLLAVDGDVVVGCVLFRPLGDPAQGGQSGQSGQSARQGRLYQMAVEPQLQRRGIGAQLVAALEAEVARRGFDEVVLHARQAAVGFYEHAGYAAEGPPFIEVGIPHVKMRKLIRPRNI